MNDHDPLLLKALKRENLTTPPIWYMRQAGRYMPEYRKIRSKFKNFLDMCKDPEVCCELALQPIEAFSLDAAILFSDILTIPDALGLKVKFVEKEGPIFENPIKSVDDVNNLIPFDPDKLSYVYEAVTNIKNALPSYIPLIGFCGSPWTLAAYSIEGRSSKSFDKTIKFIMNNMDEAHLLLSRLTDACFLYLRKQVQAGADVIQIFDSWANILDNKQLNNLSLNYIKSLIIALKQDPVTSKTPIILFAREPSCDSKTLIETSADCISLYWSMNDFDIDIARGKTALQGNLDPKILLESEEVIKNETYQILDRFKDFPGYIFNLGHGLTPDINPEKVKYLTEIVREF